MTTAIIGWNALNENSKTNRLSSRAQLYQTEQAISFRQSPVEMQHLQSIFAKLPKDTPPAEYPSRLIHLLPGNESRTVKSVHELDDLLWLATSPEDFYGKGKNSLRQAYDHVETILYHINNAYDLRGTVIDPHEWETWAGLTRDIDPHPLLLAAILHGHVNNYLSKGFATELQRQLINEHSRPIIQAFYPEMISPSWPKKLPDY